LYDVGLALNRELDPRIQMEFLVKLAMRALRTERAEFFRHDPAHDDMIFEFGIGYDETHLRRMRETSFPVGEERGMVGWVAQHRAHLNVPDVTADPRWVPLDPEIRSALWAAVQHEDVLHGVLGVFSTRANAFTPDDERMLVLLANQVSVAMVNARLYDRTQKNLTHMQALHQIDQAIGGSLELSVTLNIFLTHATAQLGVDAADILVLNPDTPILEYITGIGFRTTALQHTRLRIGDGLAGKAAHDRKIVAIDDLARDIGGMARSLSIQQEGFVSYYSVPLIAKGKVNGVLELFHRGRLEAEEEWMDFLKTLAGQAAIAIDNAMLFSSLQLSNTDLAIAYDATIEGWSSALDLRDRETEGHTQRVTDMTMRLARQMGMSDEGQVHLRRGALLHDIGKMGVPDAILLKPGPLTDEEWVTMRRHPVYAYEMLSPIAYLKPALDTPYCHHEKWDGTGYPRGLKGEQIPLVARMFAVVDVWDALRSDRPYRDAWTDDKVCEHIRAGAGTHFDPRAVEVFLKMDARRDAAKIAHSRIAPGPPRKENFGSGVGAP
jgi:HD-GYP domain-containing protein (c-di-GMP phosphodiesterase class II)